MKQRKVKILEVINLKVQNFKNMKILKNNSKQYKFKLIKENQVQVRNKNRKKIQMSLDFCLKSNERKRS